MTKRLLFLISVVCGVLIAFTIGTSDVQSYQATDHTRSRIISQTNEVAQVGQSQRELLSECPWRCKRILGIIPRSCSEDDMEQHFYTNPNKPRLVQGVNNDCYRLDWDEDKDGNISQAEYDANRPR